MQAPEKIDIKLITLAAYLSAGMVYIWNYHYDLFEKLDPLKLLLVIIMYSTIPIVFSLIFRTVAMLVMMRLYDYAKQLKYLPILARHIWIHRKLRRELRKLRKTLEGAPKNMPKDIRDKARELIKDGEEQVTSAENNRKKLRYVTKKINKLTDEFVREMTQKATSLLSLGLLIFCSLAVCVVFVVVDHYQWLRLSNGAMLWNWALWTSAIWSYATLRTVNKEEEEEKA